jgi:subtilisin family serine protease
MRNATWCAGVMALAILTGCVKDLKTTTASNTSAATLFPTNAATALNITTDADGNPMIADELLVKFKSGTAESRRMNIFRTIGTVEQRILTPTMQAAGDNDGLFLVHTNLRALDAIAKAKAMGEIEYAEPNYVYTHDATSNDTYFTNGSLWGMYGGSTTPSDAYGSNAATAWANGHTGSSSVTVGVIDEGADYQHVDLSANFWTNPGEIPGNGIDDDHDGYVDDVHGYNFVDNNGNTYDASQDDHGTHVSGTIGGVGGNGIGVAGINWHVTIISAKFLGPNGGTTANAVQAVDYITNLKTKYPQLNIVATNNSWGGGGYSQSLYDAINRANAANILFVAAAGNGNFAGIGQNTDKHPSYPASYTNPNIIAVAAIDKNGNLASFSNYGAKSVDIGAPGVAITSTLPNDTYGSYSGTSMATPHVTGTCALYAATNSVFNNAAQIKNAILSSAVRTASLVNKCVTSGRLDANAALSK